MDHLFISSVEVPMGIRNLAPAPVADHRISRRTALGLLFPAAGASLLAACSSSTPAASPTAPALVGTAPPGGSASIPTPAAPAAAGGETPKRGGALRWGQVGDIVTTDAVLSSPASNETTGEVCDELIAYSDDLKPLPRLAESWDLSSDQTRVKLNLRKGVTFHSGREFTADDVEYNILRVRDPKNPYASVVAPGSAWWTSIDKPDKNTIILTSDKPRPGLWDWMTFLRIQDKDVVDGPDSASKVGGTGPFKWVEWVPNDHIQMTRNENYWDSPRPYVDEYRVSIYRDQQTMVSALEAGTLDVAALAPIPDAVRLKSSPKFQVYDNHEVGQFFYATVNTNVSPTDNKLIRQAIGYAIDRKRFTDTIMQGFVGEPKDLPWTSTSPAFEASKTNVYTYDLDKAKSLVAQAGVSNPQMDISWALAGFSAEYQALATVIQADLAKIGITANLKPLDPPTFTQQGLGEKPPYNGMRLSAGAYGQLFEASSEFALSRTMGYASNGAGFYDDTFKSLATTAATQPDAAQRKQIYSQINDFLLDAAYVHVISAYSNIMALAGNVRGMRFEPSTFVTVREMWLA
jgi:peptide/nickel transport system substrate-binding protein